MAKTLNTDVNFRIIWEYVNTPSSGTDAPSIKDNNTMQLIGELTNGSGDKDVANLLYHGIRTVAGGADDDLDLYGGLTDSFGATLNFGIVRGIFIHNRNTSDDVDGILTIGGGSNAFASWLGASGDLVKLAAGGFFVNLNPTAAGFAVTSGTGDILRITNTGAASIEYQISIIGE